eukprot:scaffold12431_cov57-Attheya_sp.AAC.9
MLICKQQGMLTSLVGRRALVVSRSGASGSSCFSSSTSEASDGGKLKYWKKNAMGRYQRPIYVAATRQHVGKTSVSLALVSGLQKRFDKVGFVKPVGQQHVTVNSENLHRDIRVDKDVVLVRERFHLDHIDYQHMSPVIIPSGYTKKVVDGEITYQEQLDSICNSVQEVTKVSDVVLCEGTGHCGVGSIVGANNAKIASLLGADVVLVANGGLGVIINKVIPEKYEQTKHYMAKALKQSWGAPLLGCIPDRPYLGCSALADMERLFKTKLLCGDIHRFRHYNVTDMSLVTTSLTRFLENLRLKPTRTLYICHVTRDDIILGFMGEFQRRRKDFEKPFEAALLICGREPKYTITKEVKEMMVGLSDMPVMMVPCTTAEAMAKIHGFTPKLNIDDKARVGKAIEHYEPYIDFDELLRRTSSCNSSFNDPASISLEDLKRL